MLTYHVLDHDTRVWNCRTIYKIQLQTNIFLACLNGETVSVGGFMGKLGLGINKEKQA